MSIPKFRVKDLDYCTSINFDFWENVVLQKLQRKLGKSNARITNGTQLLSYLPLKSFLLAVLFLLLSTVSVVVILYVLTGDFLVLFFSDIISSSLSLRALLVSMLRSSWIRRWRISRSNSVRSIPEDGSVMRADGKLLGLLSLASGKKLYIYKIKLWTLTSFSPFFSHVCNMCGCMCVFQMVTFFT